MHLAKNRVIRQSCTVLTAKKNAPSYGQYGAAWNISATPRGRNTAGSVPPAAVSSVCPDSVAVEVIMDPGAGRESGTGGAGFIRAERPACIPDLVYPLLVHDPRRFPGDEPPYPVFFSHVTHAPGAFPCGSCCSPAIARPAEDSQPDRPERRTTHQPLPSAAAPCSSRVLPVSRCNFCILP